MHDPIKVKFKKIHPIWEYYYGKLFNMDDEYILENGLLKTKCGKHYGASDFTKSFSNSCTFGDIFEKV